LTVLCLLSGQGTRNRRTAATNMNIESSRSHAVFTLEFKQSTARHSMGGTTPVRFLSNFQCTYSFIVVCPFNLTYLISN
jgi:hypothetical protein